MRCSGSPLSRRLVAIGVAVGMILSVRVAFSEEKAAEDNVPPKQKILHALKMKTDFEFVETPLSDVIGYIRNKMGVAVMIDHKAVGDVGIATDTPVTFSAKGISIQAALGLMLRQMNLTWIVADEVLLITTPEEAESRLETRVYPVEDLVTVPTPYYFQRMYVPGMGGDGFPSGKPMPPGISGSSPRPVGMDSGMGGGVGGGMGMFNVAEPARENPPASASSEPTPAKPRNPNSSGNSGAAGSILRNLNYMTLDFDSLIEVITTTVKPVSWDEVGGAGSISSFNDTLVISQTQEVHHEIEALLDNIRAVSPGLRMVTIRATWLMLDSTQLDALLHSKPGGKPGIDPQALAQMAVGVQGYLGAISCFSGQTVHIASGNGHVAIVGAIPVVAEEAAYQPVVAMPYEGAMLQITPQLLPNAREAVLDLCSTVTTSDGAAGSVQFLSHEARGRHDRDDVVRLDRVPLSVCQLATTLKVPLGEPTLVGGLTREPYGPPKEAGCTPQLYLFLEATAQ